MRPTLTSTGDDRGLILEETLRLEVTRELAETLLCLLRSHVTVGKREDLSGLDDCRPGVALREHNT